MHFVIRFFFIHFLKCMFFVLFLLQSGCSVEDLSSKYSTYEAQHHHLLSCLERTTVRIIPKSFVFSLKIQIFCQTDWWHFVQKLWFFLKNLNWTLFSTIWWHFITILTSFLVIWIFLVKLMKFCNYYHSFCGDKIVNSIIEPRAYFVSVCNIFNFGHYLSYHYPF